MLENHGDIRSIDLNLHLSHLRVASVAQVVLLARHVIKVVKQPQKKIQALHLLSFLLALSLSPLLLLLPPLPFYVIKSRPRRVALQHESQGVLHVSLESLQPPGSDGSVDGPVIGREGSVHHLSNLESLFTGCIGKQSVDGSTNGQNARLRGVDDGREFLDAEHAQVGDGE